MFTRYDLERIFGLELRKQPPKFHFTSQGPGELDKQRLVLGGDDDCWVSAESLDTSRTKQKIIFCSTLLTHRAPQNLEILFFTALIETYADSYEVYLWSKRESTFAELRPICSAKEFWDNRHLVCGTRESDVRKILAQQGIAGKDFIVLDTPRCGEIGIRLSEMGVTIFPEKQKLFQADNCIELQRVDPDGAEQCFGVRYPDNVTTVKLWIESADGSVDRESLKILCDKFPNFTRIVLYFRDFKCKDDCVRLFFDRAILEQSGYSLFVAASEIEIEEGERGLRYFEEHQFTNLQRVVFNRVPFNRVEPLLQKLHGAIAIEVKYLKVYNIDLSAYHNLRSLNAYFRGDVKLPDGLKEVCCNDDYSGYSSSVDLTACRDLERLQIEEGVTFKGLGNCCKLKRVFFKGNRADDFLKQVPNKAELVEVEINQGVFPVPVSEDSDWLPYPNLQRLKLTYSSGPKSFLWSPRLKVLDLEAIHASLEVKLPEGLLGLIINSPSLQISLSSLSMSLVSLNLGCKILSPTPTIFPQLKVCSLSSGDVYTPLQARLLESLKAPLLESLQVECEKGDLIFDHANFPDLLLLHAGYTNSLSVSGLESLECLSFYGKKTVAINAEGCCRLIGIISFYPLEYVYLAGISSCTKLLSINLPYAKDFKIHGTPPVGCEVVTRNTLAAGNAYTINRALDEDEGEDPAVAVYKPEITDYCDSRTEENRDTIVIPGNAPSITGRGVVLEMVSPAYGKHTGESLSKHDYRLDICDRIEFTPTDLRVSFIFAPAEHDLVEYRCLPLAPRLADSAVLVQEAKSCYDVAHVKGVLERGVYYALPTLCALEAGVVKIIALQGAVKFYYHTRYKQYYFRFDEESGMTSLAFEFFAKMPPYHRSELVIAAPRSGLLSLELQQALEKEILQIPRMQFLFDSHLSLHEKTQQLIGFCRDIMQPGKFKGVSVGGTLADITGMIRHQVGVCRHKSEIFMLLARMIGVPTQIIRNAGHRYVGVGENLTEFDLGGGRPPVVRFSESQKVRRSATDYLRNSASVQGISRAPAAVTGLSDQRSGAASIFAAASEVGTGLITSDTRSSAALTDGMRAVEVEAAAAHYRELLMQLSGVLPARQITTLISPAKPVLNPLVMLESTQSPAAIGQGFMAILRTQSAVDFNRVLYIDCPKDFTFFLQPFCLQDNGSRIRIKDGPLANILTQGGIIIINWDNFSPTEIASYKSISDTHPTLLGRKAGDQVRVVGLAQAGEKYCSSFLSRHQRYRLEGELLVQLAAPAAVSALEAMVHPIEVDLFNRFNWQDQVYGDIAIEGEMVRLIAGPLIQAIDQKRPLVIYNPPDTTEFQTLMLRLTRERRVFYNGKMLNLPEETQIEVRARPYPNSLDNVSVYVSGNADLPDKQAIYLSLHNWHECFAQLVFSDNRGAEKPGWLETVSDNQYFYITGDIPRGDWGYLIATIKERFSGKHFHFLLAPGAEIEDLAKGTATVIPFAQEQVFTSNDPDYLSKQLFERETKEHKTIVVDVSLQTSYQTLIASVASVAEVQTSDGRVPIHFRYQEMAVLTALRRGDTVILNGELAPALYQQLLPLVSDEPHIYCNGKREVFSGRLIMVMPQAADQNLLCHANRTYQLADYRERFVGEDLDAFKRVRLFIQLAARLPLRGAGCPPQWLWTEERLQRLVKSIRTREFHRENPLKMWLNYHFIKESEDYAYLNVIAKLTLGASQEPTAATSAKRRQKILRLIQRFNIVLNDPSSSTFTATTHLWKLLNCFDSFTLRCVMGGEFELMFKASQGVDAIADYPGISLDLQQRLILLVSTTCCAIGTTKAVNEVEYQRKQRIQLLHFLEDEKTPAVFLKGPPGVGKTHMVRYGLSGIKCYEGKIGLRKWLEDNSDEKKVLLIDEANMAEIGAWDILKGMCRTPPEVVYGEKVYAITPQHKVILTGNSENYPGRNYHPFFQVYVPVIMFAEPSDEFLTEEILKKILPERLHIYNRELLAVYHLMHDQYGYSFISIRDMQSFAARFTHAIGEVDNRNEVLHVLYEVSKREFLGLLPTTEKRAKFSRDLAETLGGISVGVNPKESAKVQRVGEYCFVFSGAHVVEALREDLYLREVSISTGRSFYKRGVLIEGKSGVGKSTLYEDILEEAGFHPAPTVNSQKQYYEVSVGSIEVYKTLYDAFHQGSVVILDEINLDERLERFLNGLLDGADEHGKAAAKEGFMVFASQNSVSADGRKNQSSAFKSRMHWMYMDECSDQELTSIADELKVFGARQLVQDYRDIQRRMPAVGVNQRTFFMTCQEIAAAGRLSDESQTAASTPAHYSAF